MLLVTEAETRQFATPELCLAAVRDSFIALAEGRADLAPLVIGKGAVAGSTFSIKAGWHPERRVAGVKIGAYWPGNEHRGLPRHNSTVFMIDPETGQIATALEAAGMNGWRTAAADAVATDALARQDARTLAIIGSGNQARFELELLLRVRPGLRRVLIGAREVARAEPLVRVIAEAHGIEVAAVGVEEACWAADILVTATPSRAPLVEASWIRPGTHISAMGTDQAGKQELDPSLFGRARLFADHPPQSVRVGEFQHRPGGDEPGITAIGDVLLGKAPGRQSDADITIFDSSGVAIQDLLVAERVLQARDAATIENSNNAV